MEFHGLLWFQAKLTLYSPEDKVANISGYFPIHAMNKLCFSTHKMNFVSDTLINTLAKICTINENETWVFFSTPLRVWFISKIKIHNLLQWKRLADSEIMCMYKIGWFKTWQSNSNFKFLTLSSFEVPSESVINGLGGQNWYGRSS